MRSRRRALVATIAVVVVATSVFAPVRADVFDEPAFEPIDPSIPAPLRGLPDLLDPPQLAAPDPSLLTLAVPDHPWMLFTPEQIPALQDRIAAGRAATPGDFESLWPVADQYDRLEAATLDGCEVRGRCSYEDGLASFGDRDYGREDLANYGLAYHLTDDDEKRAQILANAKALLQYVVATVPDHGAPLEPGVDEFYIQRAHRLNGFAWAYDLLYDALEPAERLQLREVVLLLARQQSVHSQTAWWGTVSTGSNIGAHNGAALAQAGLALLDETPEARAWLLRGEQLVRSYFHEGFDDTGASVEGVLYGQYGMMDSTYLMHALRQAGHANDLSKVGGVDRQQEWSIYELLPEGGAMNPTNDARYLEFNEVYSLWASTHGDTPDLSRWLVNQVFERWQGGPRTGRSIATTLWYQPPTDGFDPNDHYPDSQVFDGRGLVSFRSGWGPGETLAAFEARQNDFGEGVHQNSDVNSFQFYADGARFVVDSRYANGLNVFGVGLDDEATRVSGSEAHNYLVADGRSQDFLGKGDLQVTTLASENGLADLALGDARQAWLLDQPERAERYFAYVPADPRSGAAEYVVVGDRFTQGGGAHDHTSYLHTDWTNTMTVTSDAADGVATPITACVTAPSHDESLLAAGERFDPYRWFRDTAAGDEPATVVRDAAMQTTIVTGEPTSAAVGSFTPLDQHDWERYRLTDTSKRAQPRLELSSTGTSFESLAVLAPGAARRGDRCAKGPTVTTESRTDDELVLRVEHRRGTVDRVTLALGPDAGSDAFRIERDFRGRKTSVGIGVDPSQSDKDEEPLDEQLADDPVAAVGRVLGLPLG